MYMAKGRPTYIYFKKDLLQALGRAHALFIFIYFHFSFYFFSSKRPVAGVGACARIIHFHLFLLIFLFFSSQRFLRKDLLQALGRAPAWTSLRIESLWSPCMYDDVT
jgi:riboflavin transporter FmnP